MNEIVKTIIIVLVASVIGGFVSGLVGNQSDPIGAPSGPAHYQTESFLQGLAGGTRDQFSVSNTGAITASGNITTTSGSDVVVTTSNTATSSVTVGCIQTYATSTETSVVLVPVNYATTTSAFDGSTTGMSMAAVFGTCPI